jgi:hypothetical protein
MNASSKPQAKAARVNRAIANNSRRTARDPKATGVRVRSRR